jgi:DNA polymerase I-like protein with 3'-5' exonuclease and polymerase domains
VAVLLAKMEVAGVACAPVLSDNRPALAGRLSAIKTRAAQLVGYEFNLSSSQQLAKVMYEDLRLTPPAGGALGFACSTAASAWAHAVLDAGRQQRMLAPWMLH